MALSKIKKTLIAFILQPQNITKMELQMQNKRSIERKKEVENCLIKRKQPLTLPRLFLCCSVKKHWGFSASFSRLLFYTSNR
jgi:hypothetical protein